MFKRREPDPVKKKIRQLRREQDDLIIDLRFSRAKPGSPEWEAASTRSRAIQREIQQLKKGT